MSNNAYPIKRRGRPPRNLSDQGVVYFIQAGEGGPIKIGYATNAEKRLSDLNVGNHIKLILRGTMPGFIVDEQALHVLFRDSRLNGEWFSETPAIVRFIDAMCVPPDGSGSEGALPPSAGGSVSFLPSELLPRVLKMSEVRYRLGGVSYHTVYRLMKSGQLPYIRISQTRRITEDGVTEFLRTRQVTKASA